MDAIQSEISLFEEPNIGKFLQAKLKYYFTKSGNSRDGGRTDPNQLDQDAVAFMLKVPGPGSLGGFCSWRRMERR